MSLGKSGRLAVYVGSFLLGRGLLFGAPLLLANLLLQADYGALETALAVSSIAASSLAFGTGGMVPLVVLRHTSKSTLAGIALHHLALVGACGVFAVLVWAAQWPDVWMLAALLTATVALQGLGSTYLKTLGRGESSVLLDAGLFGLMALAALAAQQLDPQHRLRWVWLAALAYAAVLLCTYPHFMRGARWPTVAQQWRAAVLLGLPLMLGGLVSLLATTSGRLGMGLLAGPLVVADYAVLARAAALPIVAHQLILIARFRHLFTLPPAEVERATLQVVLLVALSALGFWLVSPWLGLLLGPAFAAAWASHRLPGVWIVAQAVLWSAIALNDLVISRHQVMIRVLPASATYMAGALVTGWWVLQRMGASLDHFVYVHGVVMLLFYGVQSAAMRAAGVRLWRTWLCAGGTYVLMICAATLLA